MKSLRTMATMLAALAATPLLAATCSISATGVPLGNYTPNQSAPADSTGSISVQCVKGAVEPQPNSVSYSLEIGKGNSSSYSPREMTSGANFLRYNLYRDATRSNIWGDATGGTSQISAVLALPLLPAAASAVHIVYGRIFASQNAVPGAYVDSLVVTIAY